MTKKLYKLTNAIDIYWVIATNPTEAEEKLKRELDDNDFGFSSRRVVTIIKLIAEQMDEGYNNLLL